MAQRSSDYDQSSWTKIARAWPTLGRHVWRPAWKAILGEIRVPSLVIAGMSDLFTPPYLAREVAAALFEVELEIWSASGHFPFLEDAARFNRKLEMYVRRQSARATSE